MDPLEGLGVFAKRGRNTQILFGIFDGSLEEVDPIPPLIEELTTDENFVWGEALCGCQPARFVVPLPVRASTKSTRPPRSPTGHDRGSAPRTAVL